MLYGFGFYWLLACLVCALHANGVVFSVLKARGDRGVNECEIGEGTLKV